MSSGTARLRAPKAKQRATPISLSSQRSSDVARREEMLQNILAKKQGGGPYSGVSGERETMGDDSLTWRVLVSSSSDARYDYAYVALLLGCEYILLLTIITYVRYTEIDWVAYMQEVSGYEEGERDYLNIRGDTGPLVYPAGFLYLYAMLKRLAGGDGTHIKIAQLAFAVLYLLNAAAVLALYTLTSRRVASRCSSAKAAAYSTWQWRVAMALTCLSKRVHSIFVLRLFNDAPAMVLLYVSAYLFTTDRWRTGCLAFSLGVSIKMNVLLFAPGLLLLLLQSSPDLMETALRLGICATVQLVLGAPFLLTYPVSYIRKAFEFDRVFFYKWTVNWKFLPESVFVSKPLSLALLVLHLSSLVLFAFKWLGAARTQTGRRLHVLRDGVRLSPQYVTYTLLVSNFLGIAFARTLHYQFYSWYFHALPFLLWHCPFPSALRLFALICVEYAFNVYPATGSSSAVLQLAHATVLLGLWLAEVPPIIDDHADGKKKK